MTPRLRTLIELATASPEPDAVLLRKFADTRDPQAFAELVRRYGRLVWGQCRHLLNSEADADDAFQATFFTLAKSVRTLRDTNKLGPWLHGVAYRVCLNSRRLAARRTKRERSTAKTEATNPVADSAWDQAFAAVHDELARLPDTLRVPFVLCVLEGKGTTEAAEQLGLKLGTFSSRLSRAKQQLFERLSARGLTTGLAAVGAVAVGATAAPAAVAAKACDLAAGGAVSPNILSLSHGVLNMAVMNAKRWVMAAVLGCGLALGAGGVMSANGQDKKPDPKPTAADEQLKRLQAQTPWEAARAKAALEKAQADAAMAAAVLEKLKRDEERLRSEVLTGTMKVEKAAGPEFKYVYPQLLTGYKQKEFEEHVTQFERDEWKFIGCVAILGADAKRNDPAEPMLVFRRTTVKADETAKTELDRKVEGSDQMRDWLAAAIATKAKLESENDRLKKELADLKAKSGVASGAAPMVVVEMIRVGGDRASGSLFITTLVRLRYGAKAAGGLSFDTQKDLLVVKGLTQEQAEWLMATLQGISDIAPKPMQK